MAQDANSVIGIGWTHMRRLRTGSVICELCDTLERSSLIYMGELTWKLQVILQNTSKNG